MTDEEIKKSKFRVTAWMLHLFSILEILSIGVFLRLAYFGRRPSQVEKEKANDSQGDDYVKIKN